jgi:hypothetical protein
MKTPFRFGIPKDGGDRKALWISVVLHTVLVIGASSIAIVPILNLVQSAKSVRPERVTYLQQATPPAPPKVARDSQPKPKSPQPSSNPVRREQPPTDPPVSSAPPVAVIPPTEIPTTVAPPRAAGGGGDTTDKRIVGRDMLPGLSPGIRDPRLFGTGGKAETALAPPPNIADSMVRGWVRQYWDSVSKAQVLALKKPPSWTFGEEGNKWGVDPAFIYFGKFKVPTALLALIPINAQANPTAFERNRALASMQREIEYQAMRAENSKDFMESVKELRARKEAEYQARQASKRGQ